MGHSKPSGPPHRSKIWAGLSRHARYQNVGNFVYFSMKRGPNKKKLIPDMRSPKTKKSRKKNRNFALTFSGFELYGFIWCQNVDFCIIFDPPA